MNSGERFAFGERPRTMRCGGRCTAAGVDYINTDKLAELQEFFLTKAGVRRNQYQFDIF